MVEFETADKISKNQYKNTPNSVFFYTVRTRKLWNRKTTFRLNPSNKSEEFPQILQPW